MGCAMHVCVQCAKCLYVFTSPKYIYIFVLNALTRYMIECAHRIHIDGLAEQAFECCCDFNTCSNTDIEGA